MEMSKSTSRNKRPAKGSNVDARRTASVTPLFRETNNADKVSRRALVARMNRILSNQGEILRKSRPDSSAWYELGEYYTLDLRYGAVVLRHINLETEARQLGVLRDAEQLAEE